MRKLSLQALLVIALFPVPCAGAAQSSLDSAAAVDSALEFMGCYEIRFDGGTPPEFTESVPPHVWLTHVLLPKDSLQTVPAFVMRAAPGYRQSDYPAEEWAQSDRDSLVLSWNHGLSGFQIVVGVADRRSGAVWRGRTFWWSDLIEVVKPGESAKPPKRGSATLKQVDC